MVKKANLDIAKVFDTYVELESLKKTATIFGVSRVTISTKLKENNLFTKAKQIIQIRYDINNGRKLCKICLQVKNIEDFEIRKDTGKYRSWCRSCHNKNKTKWAKNNPEKIKGKERRWRKNNPKKVEEKNRKRRNKYEKKPKRKSVWQNKVPEYNRRYYIKNREKILAKQKTYRINNPEKVRESKRKWRKNNPEKVREQKKRWNEDNPNYMKEYREDNKNILSQKDKIWRADNKEKINEYYVNRYNSNVNARIASNLSARMSSILRGRIKIGSAIKDLGCSVKELKQHLESKFYIRKEIKEMMTWENYGRRGWHIDHIKPLASFDLTNREQFLEACHYTNLQPLWAEENLKKGSQI